MHDHQTEAEHHMGSSIPDRVATRMLTGVSSKLWDLRANLMEDIVDQHGPVRSVSWFAKNMPTYEKILGEWGPLRTHFIATAISIVNGCEYCAYGHAYAFQLHFFEQRDELYSISEQDMIALISSEGDPDPALEEKRQETAVKVLEQSLADSGLPDEIPVMQRALELRETREAVSEDDKRLLHLVDMFLFLNSCGINGSAVPDGAHDPINKNNELQDRYRAARAGS